MKLPCLSSLAFGLLLACQVAAGATAAELSPSPLPRALPAAEGFAADRLARIDAFMQRTTDASGYLGAVTLIARHGRVVQWQAYGHRDLARRHPIATDAIFRIYSMTKPIASVALLMLMEEGRLGLDDPVAKYLPAFRAQQVYVGGPADSPQLRAPARALTIRHLMTHTSGFATGGPGLEAASRLLDAAQLPRSRDLAEFAERVAAVPLGADPGSRFDYDGVNTEVLARIVETVSGEALDAFLQRRIFGPLRMTDTGFSVPTAQRERIVDITSMSDGGRLVIGPGPSAATPGVKLTPYLSGAGGLYSTAADYLRFAQMLLNGGTLDGQRLLGRKTVELMTMNHLGQLSPPTTTFNAGEGFGLGVSVVIDVARRGRLGSLGTYFWSGAASTYFTIDPKEQLVSILLLQHLPREDRTDLPRVSVPFSNLVYQALE